MTAILSALCVACLLLSKGTLTMCSDVMGPPFAAAHFEYTCELARASVWLYAATLTLKVPCMLRCVTGASNYRCEAFIMLLLRRLIYHWHALS